MIVKTETASEPLKSFKLEHFIAGNPLPTQWPQLVC